MIEGEVVTAIRILAGRGKKTIARKVGGAVNTVRYSVPHRLVRDQRPRRRHPRSLLHTVTRC